MNPTALSLFKSTPGAMSCAEGEALSRLAASAPVGACVECGTHSGKSAIAIAAGLNREQVLNLIDPDFKVSERQITEAVWEASSKKVVAVLYQGTSEERMPPLRKFCGDFAFVFLDSGDHSYELCRAECDIVAPRMVKGGIIAFHDLDSQFKGVRQCYDELLATGEFEEIKIPWDDILKEVILGRLEDGNQTYHHTELANPMFLGALRRK